MSSSNTKKYRSKQQETNELGTLILGTIKQIQDNKESTLLEKEQELKQIKKAFNDNIKKSDTLYLPIAMALVNAFKNLKKKKTKKVNKMVGNLMKPPAETKPSGELFLPEGIAIDKTKIEKELMNAPVKTGSRSELLLPLPGAFTISTKPFHMTPEQQAIVDKEKKDQKAKRKGGRRRKTRKKSRRRRGKGKITNKKKSYKKYSQSEKGKLARRNAQKALTRRRREKNEGLIRDRERKKNEKLIQMRMVNKPRVLERVKSYDNMSTQGKWYENYGDDVGWNNQVELDFTEGALNRLQKKRQIREEERKKREGLPVLKPLREGDSKLTDREMASLLEGLEFMDKKKTQSGGLGIVFPHFENLNERIRQLLAIPDFKHFLNNWWNTIDDRQRVFIMSWQATNVEALEQLITALHTIYQIGILAQQGGRSKKKPRKKRKTRRKSKRKRRKTRKR